MVVHPMSLYPWIHADVRHRWAYTLHRDPDGHVIVREVVADLRARRAGHTYRWYGTHDRTIIRTLTRKAGA